VTAASRRHLAIPHGRTNVAPCQSEPVQPGGAIKYLRGSGDKQVHGYALMRVMCQSSQAIEGVPEPMGRRTCSSDNPASTAAWKDQLSAHIHGSATGTLKLVEDLAVPELPPPYP